MLTLTWIVICLLLAFAISYSSERPDCNWSEDARFLLDLVATTLAGLALLLLSPWTLLPLHAWLDALLPGRGAQLHEATTWIVTAGVGLAIWLLPMLSGGAAGLFHQHLAGRHFAGGDRHG